MHTMRHFLWALVLLTTGGMPAPAPTCPNERPELSYEITIDPATEGIRFEGRVANLTCGHYTFTVAGQIGPYRLDLLDDLVFEDALGPVIAWQTAPGTWEVSGVEGDLTFRYRLLPDRVTSQLPASNAWRTVMPYRDERLAYLTRYAFVYPQRVTPAGPIRLRWHLPPDWQAVTPWGQDAQETEIPGLDDLLRNYMVAGPGLDVSERRIGSHDVLFVWTGDGSWRDVPPALPALERTLDAWMTLTGGEGLHDHLLLLLHDTARPGAITGGTAGTASVQVQVPRRMPFDAVWRFSRGNLLRTVAHEFFHTWTYFAAAPSPAPSPEPWGRRMCWFREGFTEYFAHLILYRAELLDFDTFMKDMHTQASLSHERNPDGHLSLLTACEQFYEDPGAFYYTYYEGASLAFYLDVALRRTTGGKHTLADFVRTYLTGTRTGPRTVDTFLRYWGAYAPPLQAVLRTRLEHHGSLDLTGLLDRPEVLRTAARPVAADSLIARYVAGGRGY